VAGPLLLLLWLLLFRSTSKRLEQETKLRRRHDGERERLARLEKGRERVLERRGWMRGGARRYCGECWASPL
jgi:hypothetical protein